MRNLFVACLALMLVLQGIVLAEVSVVPPAQATKPPAQTTDPPGQAAKPPAAAANQAAEPARPNVAGNVVATGPEFTIGPEDVLGILFWRDPDMSGDVAVRPDGMITLPLVRDIKAAGLTPTQLADRIQETVGEYIKDPAISVTVVVRQMNSRKVFITGEVARPGAYPLGSPMTIMQLIAVAGGLTEWAEPKAITLMRLEDGVTRTYPFNYTDVARGRKPQQNLMLEPGDTVVVPER